MNSPETLILRELLAHDQAFVSGTALAAKAGMSRVAIWQHMEKLRLQGFEFEAVRSRGYRLTARPEGLNATLIRAFLPLRDRGLTISLLDHVDSTNDEAARELANGRADPFLILAHRQLGGRGRFGRRWLSDPNGNLYASFAFRPRVEPVRMPTFTLWMGANLCDLIANFFRVTPGLKWPNDLLFEGRKAGGMLTEARIDADQIRDLVFGLGLNLRTPSGPANSPSAPPRWTPMSPCRSTSISSPPRSLVASCSPTNVSCGATTRGPWGRSGIGTTCSVGSASPVCRANSA